MNFRSLLGLVGHVTGLGRELGVGQGPEVVVLWLGVGGLDAFRGER